MMLDLDKLLFYREVQCRCVCVIQDIRNILQYISFFLVLSAQGKMILWYLWRRDIFGCWVSLNVNGWLGRIQLINIPICYIDLQFLIHSRPAKVKKLTSILWDHIYYSDADCAKIGFSWWLEKNEKFQKFFLQRLCRQVY